MINNKDLILPLLQFDNPGDCYFIQILKRRKDNPGMERNMEVVDNIFVYSLEDFTNKLPRIIINCIYHNARAYIRVNRRNTEKLALVTMKKVSDYILSKDYKAVKNAYLSAAGETHSEPNKRWIIDWDGFIFWAQKQDLIKRLELLQPEGPKVIAEIPTKNGMHFITSPFNVQHFKGFPEYAHINIHKDNPTLLFVP